MSNRLQIELDNGPTRTNACWFYVYAGGDHVGYLAFEARICYDDTYHQNGGYLQKQQGWNLKLWSVADYRASGWFPVGSLRSAIRLIPYRLAELRAERLKREAGGTHGRACA